MGDFLIYRGKTGPREKEVAVMAKKHGSSRWKPGQSGNPKGRPRKERSLTTILDKEGGEKDVTIGDKSYSKKEILAKKLWVLALNGDLAAIKYIFDRIDGRPDLRKEVDMEVSGAEDIVAILQQAHEQADKE